MLYPVTRLGEDAQLTIVDSSAYAGLHESINFWQLVARCQEVGDVLLGYYAIPDHLDEPLNTVVDPVGMEVGGVLRLWLDAIAQAAVAQVWWCLCDACVHSCCTPCL
jgi:hypothetical protein